MFDKVKKTIVGLKLKNKQRKIKKTMLNDGLTDEVLEAQVELNQLRTEHDIPDSSKKVNGDYVQ